MRHYLSVDTLKWWAIAAVIGLHYISSFALAPHTATTAWWLAINQLFRFCVPVFVALSGFALTLKYADSDLKLGEFYSRRVFKLLPLYGLWAATIYAVVHLYKPWAGFVDGYSWWQILFFGRADYHLYFVPMIFQLYVLFPILVKLFRRMGAFLLLPALLIQAGLIALITYGYHLPGVAVLFRGDQEQYLFFGFWIFYFVLGMSLTRLDTLAATSRRLLLGSALLATLLGLIWACTQTIAWHNQGIDIITATKFTRFAILPYATGFIVLGLLSEPLWAKLPGILLKPQIYLGQKSYLIYLSHTLWLRILTAALNHEAPLPTLSAAVIITLAATIFSGPVDKLRLSSSSAAQTKSH